MQNQSENSNIEEAVLVRRCQRGDANAMGQLIVKYQDRLYNTILKICGNPDDAAELTQESFVKVIENIGGFRSQSSFYTWLFRVGVNLTLTFCSRKIRLGMRSLDTYGGDSDSPKMAAAMTDSKQISPAVQAENRESHQRILAALEKLEDQHRAIIVLRDIESMSYEQIAEALDLEQGTVKSRLSRARAALRELLQAVLI